MGCTITLSGSDYRLTIADHYFYVLADGITLDIQVGPAWCGCCQKFVVGERLPLLRQLREQLKRAAYYADRPGWTPPDDRTPIGSLPELRVRERWRSHRIAPPRCLTCSSTEIIAVGTEEVTIPGHGKCRCRFSIVSMSSLGQDLYFTPEGQPTHAGGTTHHAARSR